MDKSEKHSWNSRQKTEGHLLDRHVAKTNQDLIKRIYSDEVPSTAFTNKNIASKVVLEVFRKNADDIAEWVNNSDNGARKIIASEHSFAIGKGVDLKGGNGSNKVVNGLKKSTIVLLRDDSLSSGFYIFTGYPTF